MFQGIGVAMVCYLLAQFVPIDANQLGGFIVMAFGAMGIYWLGRQIWMSHFPAKTDDQRFVTHGQFDDFREKVEKEFDDMRQELSTSFQNTQRAHQAMLADLSWLKGRLSFEARKREDVGDHG